MPSDSRSSSPATVLFVDDDRVLLNAFVRSLREARYRVLCASSATRALTILEDTRVDVVVSDERMPQLSGTRLLERVRQRFPGVTMIMLTGGASPDEAARARETLGLYRVLAKPITLRDLAHALDGALAMRRLLASTRPPVGRQSQQDLARVADFTHHLANR